MPQKLCQKQDPNDMAEAEMGNWQPVWNAQLPISTPVWVDFKLCPGSGDIHMCWFNLDALTQGIAYNPQWADDVQAWKVLRSITNKPNPSQFAYHINNVRLEKKKILKNISASSYTPSSTGNGISQKEWRRHIKPWAWSYAPYTLIHWSIGHKAVLLASHPPDVASATLAFRKWHIPHI